MPMRLAASATPNIGSRMAFARMKAWWVFPAIVFVALVVASYSVDEYLTYVATSWIIFGLTGLSLDLVWGRGGTLSLGQTAFFGLGGYAGGIAAINLAALTGNSLIWALPSGAIVGSLVSAAIGWLIFYARTGALQATILTYTFTLILWTVAVSLTATIGDAVVGGDNGMSNIPGFVLGLGNDAAALGPNGMFVTTVAVAAAIYVGVQWLMRQPFGLVIDCIRLDPVKTELLGYDIRSFQLRLFLLSGAIAGIAGALFGAWSNYLNPSVFSVAEALLIPIYVLVGGLGTLAGAFVGALVVGGLSFWLGGGVIGGQTTLIMGVALILLVLFLKGGLLGALGQIWARVSARQPHGAESREACVKIDLDLLRSLRGSRAKRSGPSLETAEILKRFGGIVPVDRVSQAFRCGQVRCLIGPNGAGKSSYLKACTGAYRPDSGTVSLAGADVTAMEVFARVQKGLGIKMQKAQVFAQLDVRRNLWVAAYSRSRNAADADRIAEAMLRMLGLAGSATRPAGELSHGEQQWLDIGMVLCLAPDVILLDEPAAGMTKDERRELSALIRALSETAAVVVVEHDMDFVRTLEADVTVLHQGRVFAQGCIQDLREDERVLDIYLGRGKHVCDR
jgi:branched-chain amino acid transport system permease protein